MSLQSFTYTGAFELENGSKIKDLEIGYNTYGTINKNRDNVVWVCHALTANSDVFDWWKGFFGENVITLTPMSILLSVPIF
jgi:homoserine O-acetyltransferase